MPFAYITEYIRQPRDGIERVLPAGHEPGVAVQRVAIGGASVQSSAFDARTTFIAVNVDATCSYQVATDPTATVSTMRIPANGTIYMGVIPGQKIAFISNT